MNNKGQVTAFISMVLVVLMIFIPAIINAIDVECAKAKSVTLLRTAGSGIKADYNRYVFDEYHLLLVDKNYYGKGEGTIEALIDSSLRANAGDAFDIGSIELSGYTLLMDDDLYEFRNQVSEYFIYGALEAAFDKVSEYVEKDKGMSDSDIEEMDRKVNGYDGGEADSAGGSGGAGSGVAGGGAGGSSGTGGTESGAGSSSGAGSGVAGGGAGGSSGTGGTGSGDEDSGADEEAEKRREYEKAKEKDPRDKVALWAKFGIGNLIKPDDLVLTDTVLDLGSLPSKGHTGIFKNPDVDSNFKSYRSLKSYLSKEKLTGGKLLNNVEVICYADKLFTSATDEYDDSKALHLEKEYLIAGKDTEIENYNYIINEIVGIKFVMNLIYLLSDAEKMGEVEALAAALTALFPPAEPVVTYLLAACWAYAESVVDAYRLIRGNKVALVKDRTTWKTSFDKLGEFSEAKNDDSDSTGLTYDQFLLMFMALRPNDVAYRILDVIEVNTVKNGYKGFSMKNAITSFGINAEISYGSSVFCYREEFGF